MSVKNICKQSIKVYKDLSLPVKASLWFVVCNVLQKGIAVITVPIFTRMMTTEQYGMYSVYTSWEAIIVIIVTLRISYAAYNNGLVKHDADIPRLTSSYQGLSTVIIGVSYALYLIFREPINSFVEMNTLMISLMFLQMLVQPAYELWCAKQRFEYKYKTMAVMTLGLAVSNPLLGVVAVYLSEDKALARIAAGVLAQLIFCGALYIYNAFKGKAFFVREYWRYALLISIPLLPHYLSTTIMNQFDRVMIQKMCGLTDAAIYGISHSAAYLVTLFTNAINNSLLPWTYQKLKAKDYKALYNTIPYIILMVAVLMALIIAFGPNIVALLATEEYYAAVWVIPPLAGGLFFCFIYQVYSNVEFYFEYRTPALIISVSATVLNLVLNYIFINIYGFVAAGYTTLFCYFCFAVSHCLVTHRIVKKEIGNSSIYNIKLIIGISIGFMVLMAIFIASYANNYARYIIIGIMLVICIIKREKIIWLVNIIRNKN